MGMVKNIAVNAELSHTLLFLTTVFFGISKILKLNLYSLNRIEEL